jgi:hypothetical protein
MTDLFGQVRSRSCQLPVMVAVTVIGYMAGSCGHGHASAVDHISPFFSATLSAIVPSLLLYSRATVHMFCTIDKRANYAPAIVIALIGFARMR